MGRNKGRNKTGNGLIPGKANAERQKDFVERYQNLKAEKAPDDPIYFMDATHPQHNPVAGYGWIKRGQDHGIRSNTGRQRININGAIDCAGLCPIVRYDDTINAQSTVALLQQIEQQHPTAARFTSSAIMPAIIAHRSLLNTCRIQKSN